MHIRRELFEMFFMNRIPRSGFTLDEPSEAGSPPSTQSQPPGGHWLDAGTNPGPSSPTESLRTPLGGVLGQDRF
jgi:hypothetical protein